MRLISKLYQMADNPELPREEGKELEDLVKFVISADRPEALLRLGEAALKEGIREGWPTLIKAGHLLKEEARKWGEKLVEARQARAEARRRTSCTSLGDLLKAAM